MSRSVDGGTRDVLVSAVWIVARVRVVVHGACGLWPTGAKYEGSARVQTRRMRDQVPCTRIVAECTCDNPS